MGVYFMLNKLNFQEQCLKVGILGDPEKSDPRKSVIERKLRGRLENFQHCSVPIRQAYIMSIFRNFFRHSRFPELRISWKGACLISSKSREKQGIDVKPFQIL